MKISGLKALSALQYIVSHISSNYVYELTANLTFLQVELRRVAREDYGDIADVSTNDGLVSQDGLSSFNLWSPTDFFISASQLGTQLAEESLSNSSLVSAALGGTSGR